jgi:hypothetical protein
VLAMRRFIDITGDLLMLTLVTLLVPVAILLIGLPVAGLVKLASVLVAKAIGSGV